MNPGKINKSKYGLRIFLGVFLPTPMGIVVLTLPMNASIGFEDMFNMGSVLILSVAYGIMIIPSAIYSFLMEHIINPKIRNHFLATLISTLIGFVSGIWLGLGLGIIGAIVGLVLGIILRWSYIYSSPNNKPNVA